MNPVEDELERLKRRKLLEIQRRMMKETQVPEEAAEPKERSSKEILNDYFGSRAWEVFNAAMVQFPTAMPKVEKILVEAIKEGRVRQRIDGGSLFHFLRQIGIPVRLQTTIRYKEHGELKTIGQIMREKR
jgi:DNA-binding TFAR19-related protein (PDSD5 family)